MRVAVFSARQVPKRAIYSALDALHGESGLFVIGWAENHGGAAALDWAASRPGAESVTVSSVRASDTRFMGRFFDARAAVICCYKVYRPDRALVFSSPYWVSSGIGHLICQNAEKWGVPLHLYAPKHNHGDAYHPVEAWDDPPTAKVVELCHKKAPMGKTVCTRFKGHPTAWHWSMRMGERVSKFWAP